MKTKILNDPVYGFIRVPTPLIFELIEHPWFQRLRRIKQMAFAHYVYPGALHTRFHHALGSMHLMQRALQTLHYKGVDLSDEEAESVLCAILLHDIGHGPYSHTLEGILVDINHEAITLKYMQELNEEFNGRLSGAIDIFTGNHPKQFLHELVSGQLDIDRMDYLKRDSFYSGVIEGDIGHDRILYMLDIRDGHVVVEQKGIFSVEQFLFARKLMYWQVYLHKAVLSVDGMLKQTFSLLKSRIKDGNVPRGLPPLLEELLNNSEQFFIIQPRNQALAQFSRIDDVDVLYTLKVLSNCGDPVLELLSYRILDRRLFAVSMLDAELTLETHQELIALAARHFRLDEIDAGKLIIKGFEKIPTYRKGRDEIMMLLKNGEVKPFSEIRNITEDAVSEQYYVCYPKELRKYLTDHPELGV